MELTTKADLKFSDFNGLGGFCVSSSLAFGSEKSCPYIDQTT